MTRKRLPSPQNTVRLELEPGDLLVLQAALREANQELEDWEFETRMGLTREALREVLRFFTVEVERG